VSNTQMWSRVVMIAVVIGCMILGCSESEVTHSNGIDTLQSGTDSTWIEFVPECE
jgi:hypothetical protein